MLEFTWMQTETTYLTHAQTGCLTMSDNDSCELTCLKKHTKGEMYKGLIQSYVKVPLKGLDPLAICHVTLLMEKDSVMPISEVSAPHKSPDRYLSC